MPRQRCRTVFPSCIAWTVLLAWGPAAAQGARYSSTRKSFTLELPAGYALQDRSSVNLDVAAWQLDSDHDDCGAIWRVGDAHLRDERADPARAVDEMRKAHLCGAKVCGSTPVRAQLLKNGATLFFYEVADPSIPSSRGVLSGLLVRPGDIYRVQALNFDAKTRTLGDVWRILSSLAPAVNGDGALSGPGVVPDPTTPITFSGESDIDMQQTSRSSLAALVPNPTPPDKQEAPAAHGQSPHAQINPRPAPKGQAHRRAKPASLKPREAAETLPAPVPIPRHESPPRENDKELDEPEPALRYDPLPTLIELLRHPAARTRFRAADELGRRGAEAASAVPALIETLKDADVRVRASAALALGNLGPDARAAIPDLTLLLKDANVDVRLSARTALDHLAGP